MGFWGCAQGSRMARSIQAARAYEQYRACPLKRAADGCRPDTRRAAIFPLAAVDIYKGEVYYISQ